MRVGESVKGNKIKVIKLNRIDSYTETAVMSNQATPNNVYAGTPVVDILAVDGAAVLTPACSVPTGNGCYSIEVHKLESFEAVFNSLVVSRLQ